MRRFALPSILLGLLVPLAATGSPTSALLPAAHAQTTGPATRYLRQRNDEVLRILRREATTRMETRGAPYADLGKVKSQVARDQRLPVGEDLLPYLLEQILEMLFHSQNVEEVFAEDTVLRKKITAILRRHMDVEQELDREVRGKIKNLEEGTAAFETEYARVMDQIKRNKKLS